MPTSQLEIEFKNLLTKKEFHALCHQLHIGENQFKLQKNYYFDTAEGALKSMNTAFRLRIKSDSAELMLKIATEDVHEHIEISEFISNNMKDPSDIVSWSELIPESFHSILASNDIPLNTLVNIAKISTFRAEKEYDKGRLFIDYNRYGKEDYELELEYPDLIEGEIVFNDLLIQHNLDRRPTKAKIARAVEYANSQK